MNWKLELDALVESTMAFARDVERRSIPDLPVTVRTAEQRLPTNRNRSRSQLPLRQRQNATKSDSA
jgi:hypothetical protein